MSFLKSIFNDATALDTLGIGPRAAARAAGVESFFCEVENDGDILVERPDGSVAPYRERTKVRLKATAR